MTSKGYTLETIHDIIKCSICLGSPKNPRFCPICSALFCFDCISKWIDTNPTCPACRNTLNNTNLSSNLIVSNILNELSKSQEYIQPESCSLHHYDRIYYCNSCLEPICSDCALFQHKDHNIEKISIIYNKNLEILKVEEEALKKRQEELMELSTFLETDSNQLFHNKTQIEYNVQLVLEDIRKRLNKDVEQRYSIISNAQQRLNVEVAHLDNLYDQLVYHYKQPPSKFIDASPLLAKQLQDIHKNSILDIYRPISTELISELSPPYEHRLLKLRNFIQGQHFVNRITWYGTSWELKCGLEEDNIYLNLKLLETISDGKYYYKFSLINQRSNINKEFESKFPLHVGKSLYIPNFSTKEALINDGFLLPDNDILLLEFSFRSQNYYFQSHDLKSYIKVLENQNNNLKSRIGLVSPHFSNQGDEEEEEDDEEEEEEEEQYFTKLKIDKLSIGKDSMLDQDEEDEDDNDNEEEDEINELYKSKQLLVEPSSSLQSSKSSHNIFTSSSFDDSDDEHEVEEDSDDSDDASDSMDSSVESSLSMIINTDLSSNEFELDSSPTQRLNFKFYGKDHHFVNSNQILNQKSTLDHLFQHQQQQRNNENNEIGNINNQNNNNNSNNNNQAINHNDSINTFISNEILINNTENNNNNNNQSNQNNSHINVNKSPRVSNEPTTPKSSHTPPTIILTLNQDHQLNNNNNQNNSQNNSYQYFGEIDDSKLLDQSHENTENEMGYDEMEPIGHLVYPTSTPSKSNFIVNNNYYNHYKNKVKELQNEDYDDDDEEDDDEEDEIYDDEQRELQQQQQQQTQPQQPQDETNNAVQEDDTTTDNHEFDDGDDEVEDYEDEEEEEDDGQDNHDRTDQDNHVDDIIDPDEGQESMNEIIDELEVVDDEYNEMDQDKQNQHDDGHEQEQEEEEDEEKDDDDEEGEDEENDEDDEDDDDQQYHDIEEEEIYINNNHSPQLASIVTHNIM